MHIITLAHHFLFLSGCQLNTVMGKNVHATNTLPKQLLPDWHGRRKKGERHDEPHAHMNIGSEPGGTHVNINWEYVIVPSPEPRKRRVKQ